MQQFGGVDQGLRRHTAAQDAKSAEIFSIINDCDAVERFACGAGRCIAATAAADYNIVEMLCFHEFGRIKLFKLFVIVLCEKGHAAFTLIDNQIGFCIDFIDLIATEVAPT